MSRPGQGKDAKVRAPGVAAPITPFTMNRMRAARIFHTSVEQPVQPPAPQAQIPPRHITGLSFDDSGEFLITGAEDETFRLYNAKSGKHVKTLYSKKYGVDLPRFTHKASTIIYASTKEEDTIRYHSLHDNKYLQYFRGHKKRVISLEMSPVNDTFLSSAEDNTVRLWDLRSATAQGLLNAPRAPVIAYDNTGVVFAIALASPPKIALYDAANFDTEPFLNIVILDHDLAKKSFPPRTPLITSLTFSSNSKWLLVGTSGDTHYIVDSFTGHLLARLEGHSGLERGKIPKAPPPALPARGISGHEICFTPDSKFVIAGDHSGKWYAWDVSTNKDLLSLAPGEDARTLKPMVSHEGHIGPIRCARWNPRLGMLATAGEELAFWLPEKKVQG